MSEQMEIYDELCAALCAYEEAEGAHSELEDRLYDMLVKIQRNWECVITAESDASAK